MSTRGAIKIREKGEELRIFYGHDAYPSGLGYNLRRYLNMNDHRWSAMRIFNDLCGGKCLKGSFDNLTEDYDFKPVPEFGGYEGYGYLIDCNNERLVCYSLPGFPAEYQDLIDDPKAPIGNSNDDDWSGREVVELPYKMVSEDVTTERIKAAVAEYLYGREKPKPFGASLSMGNDWSVHISVEYDKDE